MNKVLKKTDIFTIPNILSFFRLLLIPLIVWCYLVPKNYNAAIVLLILSGITDIVDGKIARKFNMISNFGKVLDPIADKLTQAAMIFCLISRYRILWFVIALFAVKETLMITYGYVTLKITDTVNGAKWYGKLNTVLIYTVIMILIIFTEINLTLANILIICCTAGMILSLVLYIRFYINILLHAKSND